MGRKHVYYTVRIVNDVEYVANFVQCMPFYHSAAFILCFVPCLHSGTTCAIGHKFSNRTFWKEVRASKATIIQYVGETCRYLLAAPPLLDPQTGKNLDADNCVQIALGNGLRPDVWGRFKERFGIETICEFYAATEGPSSVWNVSSNSFSTGAVGRSGNLVHALTKKKLAVVALDYDTEIPKRDPAKYNFCIRVPPNTPGELLYRLDPNDISFNFQGYFNNERASASKIMRDVFVRGDAWFRTGDVMRIDSENRMYFCDRIGDTFRWRSENVATSEVSECLGRHPAVHEANVYGVEIPHHDGRAGCAAISLSQEPSKQLMQSLATHVNAGLPKYAVPIFLRVTSEMVTTGNNKQQKGKLRSEGVDPTKTGDKDRMYWLQGGEYVEFGRREWERLSGGGVKL